MNTQEYIRYNLRHSNESSEIEKDILVGNLIFACGFLLTTGSVSNKPSKQIRYEL